jgi:integrase/recombinase XerD
MNKMGKKIVKPYKKKKQYSKEWLSKDEMKKLLESPDIESRDTLLIKVCYFAGIRIGEALEAKYEDFKFEDGYSFLLLRKQKTDKRNWEKQPVPIHLLKDVKDFCEDNRIRMQDFIFQTRQTHNPESEHMSYDRAYQICKECAGKVGITKKITTHTFRRSRLSHMLDDGDDIFVVMKFARHKSIDTTLVYVKTAKKKLFEQMNEIDKKGIFDSL